MSEFAILICSVMLAALPVSQTIDLGAGYDTCGEVVGQAREHGAPLSLSAALAYHETKFDADAVSSSGAIGPLQVLPVWSCEDVVACRRAGRRGCRALVSQCDAVKSGVVALRGFLAASKWERRAAVCKYTGCAVTGNTGFVSQILATDRWLQASIDCACSLPMGSGRGDGERPTETGWQVPLL